MLNSVNLHAVKILPVGIEDALEVVIKRIPEKNGDYFCLANIHLVMESHKDAELKKILNESAGNFPDGMGVAWALKFFGCKFEDRVRGTDLMLRLCDYAEKNKLKIFLYGSTKQTLNNLKKKIETMFPKVMIAGMVSPPFRPLTKEEDELYTRQVNYSGADILFVSLGAPKQEKWMYEHKGRIKAVQLGVGAAFDFITGNVKQAPRWMQKSGLEWLFRLPQQPRKTLYRMSLVPGFIVRTMKQFFKLSL